ncbi:MAG: PKD domain-containing protein [Candidatus Bipolaricaulia bacterium]
MRRRAWIVGVLVLVGVSGCFGPTMPPIAGFTSCPNGWQGKLEVQFSSTSSTVDNHWIVLHTWEFGDGETSQDYSGWASHAYAEEGIYTVRLTVEDDRGLTATSERSIEVSYPAVLSEVAVEPGSPSRAVGYVENGSATLLRSVTIKVKFYDSDGTRIGEGYAEVTDIDPGERVRFAVEGPSYPDVVASARAMVTAYVVECAGNGPVPVYEDRADST